MHQAEIRVVQTPYQAPNANAYVERFVRSINEECLDRTIPLGERHFRRALSEFVAHYHRERNHQGLENALIDGGPTTSGGVGRLRCRPNKGTRRSVRFSPGGTSDFQPALTICISGTCGNLIPDAVRNVQP